MLVLRMGQETAVAPSDPIGRQFMGWSAGLTAQECWDRTRGLWKLQEGRALEQDEAVVVDPDWVVRAVAKITGITKHGEKRAIEGVLIPDHELLGTDFPWPNKSRNSVSYR
jgi:hypothetical protein